MLSAADNDLLTQVDPGTPMGGLMREFWIPAIRADELPEADGAPLRIRLLCENLIAFRATSGRVGIRTQSTWPSPRSQRRPTRIRFSFCRR